MFRSRSHLQAFALWLALAGVVLRGLVPVGFMPGWTETSAEPGARSWLIICPTSPLHAALQAPATGKAAPAHHDHAAMLAAAAAASAAASADDPHAHHHHHHAAAASADAPAMAMAMPMAGAAADPHAGHDPSQHGGHRIAAEHLSCPFAGAGSPALPTADASFHAAGSGRCTVASTEVADAVPSVRRRLPPARAPPAAFDDHAVG